MIQKTTQLNVVDKCGLWTVNVFHLYKGGFRKCSNSGDFVKVSVRKTRPTHWLFKKAKLRGILIHTCKEKSRKDGSLINFKINSIVLLKKRMTPRGKEIVGSVSFGNKRKKFTKSFQTII